MLREFTKYVSQSVVGMIGISIYILADTFFISVSSGADGLAVLNLILPIYGIMYALGAMIGIGSATSFAIRKATGNETKFFFGQSLAWCVIFSVFFILLGIFMPEKVLMLMGADNQLVALGKNYIRIILLFSPFFMCNYTFTAFVRNDGAPVVAMIGSALGSIFNIVFDYVFMFPMGMGFTGAALATAFSPIVTMSVCLFHYLSPENQVEFKLKVPSFRDLVASCRLGAPAFVGEIAAAVTTITFNALILEAAGNTGVAAYGVIANVALVVIAVFNGISQGIQPLISNNYGCGKTKEVSWMLKMGIGVSMAVATAILAVIFLGTDQIISIFNSEENMRLYEYAYTGMRLYFLGFIIAPVNIILVTYFAATDRGIPSLIGSVFRGLIGIVIFAVIFAKIWGITGIWLSFLAAEATTFVVILLLRRSTFFFKNDR